MIRGRVRAYKEISNVEINVQTNIKTDLKNVLCIFIMHCYFIHFAVSVPTTTSENTTKRPGIKSLLGDMTLPLLLLVPSGFVSTLTSG